ncbi:MAG TPA: hypothetical protein VK858_07065 [Longimicrobiales bacterium]|nr:hypothetical protein [Longimicrobiales bacterium]
MHTVPASPSAALLVALSGLAVAIPHDAAAQSHYWSDHFGNESILLNGTVIGSVTDAGAVFYNPARLLHQEDPVLLAGAKAYEWTSTRVSDALGPDEDLATSGFRGVPGFVVGSFTIPALEGHQFAYGILTRYRGRSAFTVREERQSVVPALPGDDLFVGFSTFGAEYKDDWFGLSWARPVTDDLGLGVSLFYYDRDFARRSLFDYRAVDDLGNAATLQVERGYSVDDKGLVAKAGLAWRRDGMSVGLSLTLPYWSFSGKGRVSFDDFLIGIPDSTGTPDAALRSLEQSGLPLDWRSPWSVGAGVGWVSGPWQLHLAAEFFGRVPAHVLLRTDPDREQLGVGNPVDYSVTDERRAVLNGGLGVRWAGSDRIAVFASVASNVSAAPDSVMDFSRLDTTASHTSLQSDFVLVGGGASVRTPWGDFTLGASWQAGRDGQARSLGLPDGTSGPGGGNLSVHVTQWRFLAGFSIPRLGELLGDVVGS